MKKIILAASLLSITSANAVAQQTPGHTFKAEAKELFQALDINSDGIVTHDELMKEAAGKFAEFDADGNGVVILTELPDVMPLSERAEHRLARMKERRAANPKKDGQNSRRSDKQVSPEEIAENHRPTRMKFMAKFDRDGNEQLSVEEFAGPMIKRFKRMDINGDGSVTSAEFDEALEKRRSHKREHGKRGARR